MQTREDNKRVISTVAISKHAINLLMSQSENCKITARRRFISVITHSDTTEKFVILFYLIYTLKLWIKVMEYRNCNDIRVQLVQILFLAISLFI